jgi:uncharacterized protein
VNGTISYVELGSGNDASKTSDFFAQLFGWNFTPMGSEGGGWFQTPTILAGLHGNDSAPAITPFFQVADLTAAVAKVRELGGHADDPGPEEAGFGQFSNCRDPQGICFGLHRKPNG